MKYELKLKGRTYVVEVELAEPMQMPEFRSYAPAPTVPVASVVEAASNSVVPMAAGDGECVASPMPGNILKVNVVAGQAVKEGEVLVVLEAMKMENEIMASKSGTVTQVLVEKGATVETGAPLVFIR